MLLLNIMKKVLIVLIVFFIPFFLFKVNEVAATVAPLPNPVKGFLNKPAFEMQGVTCGYAGTEINRCCKNDASQKQKVLDKEEFNSVIEKIRNGNYKDLTKEEAEFMGTLFLIAEEFSGIADEFESPVDLGGGIFDKFINEENLTQQEKNELIRWLTKNYNAFQTLGGNIFQEKVRELIPPEQDKCLINSFLGDGLCLRGTLEFFAGIAGNLPGVDEITKTYREEEATPCINGDPSDPENGPQCRCVEASSSATLCTDYINTNERQDCIDCNGRSGVWTGLGCIRTTFSGFVQETLLGWGIGLAGIIALICIIYSAFILQTSRGNPERIKKAREYLTNCIIGLLLILFSIFILRLVGITILHIPGFS